jgi:hypothetical protein
VHGFALGMWRRAEDVEAFVRSDVHRWWSGSNSRIRSSTASSPECARR